MGNLRRHLLDFAFNTVSWCRRSAQALLTLASPSAQVVQSRSCSPFQSDASETDTPVRGSQNLPTPAPSRQRNGCAIVREPNFVPQRWRRYYNGAWWAPWRNGTESGFPGRIIRLLDTAFRSTFILLAWRTLEGMTKARTLFMLEAEIVWVGVL
jgi:hypothetical protein